MDVIKKTDSSDNVSHLMVNYLTCNLECSGKVMWVPDKEPRIAPFARFVFQMLDTRDARIGLKVIERAPLFPFQLVEVAQFQRCYARIAHHLRQHIHTGYDAVGIWR